MSTKIRWMMVTDCILDSGSFCEDHAHFVFINFLPISRGAQLARQQRSWTNNRDAHAVAIEGLVPVAASARDADIFACELFHVDITPVDEDRIRRQRPEQIVTPDVWVRKRVSGDLFLL